MKRRSKDTHFSTLKHLFDRAQESARYELAAEEIEVLADRLENLWSDYDRHSERRRQLTAQIEVLGAELKIEGAMPALDEDVAGITAPTGGRTASQRRAARFFGRCSDE